MLLFSSALLPVQSLLFTVTPESDCMCIVTDFTGEKLSSEVLSS